MPGKPESKVEIAKRQGRHLRGTIADTLASEADALRSRRHGAAQVPRHLPAGRPRRAAVARERRPGEGLLVHGARGDPGGRGHRRAVPRPRAHRRRARQRHPPGHHPPGVPVPRRAQGRSQADHRRHQPRAPHHHLRLRRRAAERHGLLRAAGRCRPHRHPEGRGGAGARAAPGHPRLLRDLARRAEAGLDRAGGAVLRRPLPAAEVQDRGRPLDRQLRGHLVAGRRAARRGAGRPHRGLQRARGRRARHDPQQGRHHRAPGGAARVRGDGARRRGGADRGRDLPRSRKPERPPARRLKYLLAEWGMPRFRAEFQRRAAFVLGPAVALSPLPFHDHLGRHRQSDGRWFYGVFIQSGRIVDAPGHELKTRPARDRHPPSARHPAHRSAEPAAHRPRCATASRRSSGSSRRTGSRCRPISPP